MQGVPNACCTFCGNLPAHAAYRLGQTVLTLEPSLCRCCTTWTSSKTQKSCRWMYCVEGILQRSLMATLWHQSTSTTLPSESRSSIEPYLGPFKQSRAVQNQVFCIDINISFCCPASSLRLVLREDTFYLPQTAAWKVEYPRACALPAFGQICALAIQNVVRRAFGACCARGRRRHSPICRNASLPGAPRLGWDHVSYCTFSRSIRCCCGDSPALWPCPFQYYWSSNHSWVSNISLLA